MDNDDHAQRAARAEQIVIEGLARGDGLDELEQALGKIARKGDFVLGERLIRLASETLGLGGFNVAEPVAYEGLREKYLAEIEFRGRVSHRNSQYALYAAAALMEESSPTSTPTPVGGKGNCGSTPSMPWSPTSGPSPRGAARIQPMWRERWPLPEGRPSTPRKGP